MNRKNRRDPDHLQIQATQRWMSMNMSNPLRSDQTRILIIAGLIVIISLAHYLVSAHQNVTHNILQRLYHVPILLAAYQFGRKGGTIAAVSSSVLYIPHVLVTWQMHPTYQINQILEIVLFLILGIAAGALFDQKVKHQRQLQSFEKAALFGSLAKSLIKSLKGPIKGMKGMLIALEPASRYDSSISFCAGKMQSNVAMIESLRNDLISIVERNKFKLRQVNLHDLLDEFASEISSALRLIGIRVSTDGIRRVKPVYANEEEIVLALRKLVGIVGEPKGSKKELKFYSGDSETESWIGATTQGIRLPGSYSYLNELAETDNYFEHDLIPVIKIMNNHFGDVRFVWDKNRLLEFALVFPKHLKLSHSLRDETNRSEEVIDTEEKKDLATALPLVHHEKPESPFTEAQLNSDFIGQARQDRI